MRIVLLPSAFAPSVGGVEVLTHRLAISLREAGHEVEIWTGRSDGDALAREDVIDGFVVRRFVFAAPRARLSTLPRWWGLARSTSRQLRAAVARFRPDLLHVQCFSGNGAYATWLSRQTGTSLVVTLQGETVMDDHDIFDRSAFLRFALRRGLRTARRVTACSAFTLDDAVRRFGLDSRKASVVFNGVDHDEASLVPVGLPFDRYVLGLGRFVHKKGFDLLVRAFADVLPRHPGVGLVIAGSGAAEPDVRDLVASLGVDDRVHLAGRLGRGEVATAMAGADVFVMPSRVEPFGIVALEGWRAGTPVIVTARGGAPEFVENGVSGLVADPEDTAALAVALDRVLSDPVLRERLADAGRQRVKEFSWSAIRAQYEKVYSEALAEDR